METSACPVCFRKFTFYSRPKKCADCCTPVCSDCFEKPKGVKGFDKICLRCYEKNHLNNNSGRAAPDALAKRLSSLKNPNAPPPVVVYCENRYSSLKRGLSKEDADLVDRLAKLKEKTSDTPSEETIAARLAQLKESKTNHGGESSAPKRTSSSIPNPKPETPEDLIKRMTEEVKLDESSNAEVVDSVDYIAERLRRLRGENSPAPEQKDKKKDTDAMEDDDLEEKDAEKVAARYLAEAKLETDADAKGITLPPTASISAAVGDKDEDVEELPWCAICNEDAALRCLSCQDEKDSSLFCVSCYHELHDDDPDFKKHRAVGYKGDL